MEFGISDSYHVYPKTPVKVRVTGAPISEWAYDPTRFW
jgi:hypothetical protein